MKKIKTDSIAALMAEMRIANARMEDAAEIEQKLWRLHESALAKLDMLRAVNRDLRAKADSIRKTDGNTNLTKK